MSTPAGWYVQPDGQQRYWDGEQWTEHFAPGGPPTVTPPAVAVKNWFLRHKVMTAIGAVLLLGTFSGIASGSTKSNTETTVAIAPTAEPAATSAADKAAAAKAAAEIAAAVKAAEEKAAAEKAAEEKAAEEVRNNPASYKTIGAREYALLIKDPDAHVGEKYVIYGYVTQFDSATGTDTFRASTASSRQSEWYDYNENTIATAADASDFANVVKDDLVTLYVEVLGSLSYDTQIGGNTTVPNMRVHIIKVTGTTK